MGLDNKCMLCQRRCAERYCCDEHERRAARPPDHCLDKKPQRYAPPGGVKRELTDEEIAKADKKPPRARKRPKKRKGRMGS